MKLLNRITASQLFLIIASAYIIGFFAHALYLKKTVYGDGVYYYSWLRSVVIDHDVRFTNEYAHLGGGQPKTALGTVGNKYSIGPAILWAPGYIAAHDLLRGDGYAFPYQLIVGIVSVLSTLFGLVLLWNLLKKYFSGTVAIATTATIAGASNLLFYGSIDAVNSHALTFFTATVYISLLLAKKKHWFATGIFLGLLGLIRTQDVLYAVLLIPVLGKSYFVRSVRNVFIGFFIIFLPQLVAWQLLYGKFWMSPYLTGSEGFNFWHPQIIGVLLSIRSGLFLWTPVTALGVAGFFTGKVKRIPIRFWMFAVFILELYTVASWSTWWQGASYSGRMFVSSLPIFAFGLASIFSRLSDFTWNQAYFFLTITGPLTIINGVSIIYFLLSLPGRP